MKISIHRPLVQAVGPALEAIFSHGHHADRVIERALKSHRQWGSRDRRFFAEITYDVVRWWRRLDWSIKGEPNSKFESSDQDSLVKAYVNLKYPSDTPDWLKMPTSELSQVRERWETPPTRTIVESIPDWLDSWGEEELGADWPSLLRSLNEPAPVFLRANRLRVTREELIRRLADEGVEVEAVFELPDGLRLVKRTNVFRTQSFLNGDFEMQDGGSQMIAPLLGVKPGQRVIDACAGAGGKTLHLAALMGNQGRLIAMDVHEKKLEELKKRLRRAGVHIAETRLIDSSKVIKRLKGSADAVLLDVPCSGLGVLRRHPDQKWKMNPDEIRRLQGVQAEILTKYSEMVKPGGAMVYATCSILPSENQKQVQSFLASHGDDWRLGQELVLRPDQNPFDGFYAAQLLRTVSKS